MRTLNYKLIILVVLFNIILFSFQVQSEPLAEGKSKFLGNITNYPIPSNFENYWNQVTPQIHGKWASVEYSRDNMQWDKLDKIYLYAKERGFSFMQHTFVFGNREEPNWLASLSPAEQKEEVEEWMRLFGQRYPDADYINVVNEPIKNPPSYKNAIDGDGSTGWDWVIWSFQKAREYCPNAKLMINEWGILNGWTSIEDYLKIINLLRERGLIDGIGIGGHFLETKDISIINYKLEKLAETGLSIYITGYDVDTVDDNEQLKKYQEQFPLFWRYPAVKGITLGGYIKGTQWRKEAYLIRADGTERPALKWLREYLSDKN